MIKPQLTNNKNKIKLQLLPHQQLKNLLLSPSFQYLFLTIFKWSQTMKASHLAAFWFQQLFLVQLFTSITMVFPAKNKKCQQASQNIVKLTNFPQLKTFMSPGQEKKTSLIDKELTD
jgi:hypothetical protein